MSKVHVLVAMEREAESLGLPCSVIGIGAENIRKRIKADDIVINVGYCGAIGLEPGTIVEPSEAVSLKNGARIFIRPKFDFLHAPCYTAEEFVAEPKFEAGAICDMELFKLAKIPCKELYALKIVSDNLNEADCEEFDGAEQWAVVRDIVLNIIKEAR